MNSHGEMQEPKKPRIATTVQARSTGTQVPSNVRGTGGGAGRKQKISSSGMGHGSIQEREVSYQPGHRKRRSGLDVSSPRLIGSARMALEKESCGTGRPRSRWMANIRLMQVQGTPVRLAIPLHIGMADGPWAGATANGEWRACQLSVVVEFLTIQ